MSDPATRDGRTFLALATTGATCALSGAPAPTAPWSDSLIVNALGGLDNPNVETGSPDPTGLNPGARKRLRLDERALSDARASGLAAVNWTMG